MFARIPLRAFGGLDFALAEERLSGHRAWGVDNHAAVCVSAELLLPGIFFLLGAVSGFAAYRLASLRKKGRPQNAALVRVATMLAYAWLALSALLVAWAAMAGQA